MKARRPMISERKAPAVQLDGAAEAI